MSPVQLALSRCEIDWQESTARQFAAPALSTSRTVKSFIRRPLIVLWQTTLRPEASSVTQTEQGSIARARSTRRGAQERRPAKGGAAD